MAYPIERETAFSAKNGKTINFRPERAADTEML
jgi:hypothetical protein